MSPTANFFVPVELENPHAEGFRCVVPAVVVDTGAALSWFPATVLRSLKIKRRELRQFVRPDGRILTRRTGEALMYVAGRVTIDEVVFGEESDPPSLGARSLTGLNLAVDPVMMRLVDKGPAPVVALVSL